MFSPFFCASFFRFFLPCPPHPSPGNFFPKILSFWDVAPQEKKENPFFFFSGAREKVSVVKREQARIIFQASHTTRLFLVGNSHRGFTIVLAEGDWTGVQETPIKGGMLLWGLVIKMITFVILRALLQSPKTPESRKYEKMRKSPPKIREKYRTNNQARKRHININFFVRLVLGRPGFVPGIFSPGLSVKTWDKPGFSPYFTQWKPGKPGFVPGTNPVCPWDNPGERRAVQKVHVKKVYVPFPLASYSVQKRPEPQICQKSVPAIVFGGSSQGDWNLSKVGSKYEKR